MGVQRLCLPSRGSPRVRLGGDRLDPARVTSAPRRSYDLRHHGRRSVQQVVGADATRVRATTENTSEIVSERRGFETLRTLLGRSCFRGFRLEAASEDLRTREGVPARDTRRSLRFYGGYAGCCQLSSRSAPDSPVVIPGPSPLNALYPWFVARLLGANFCRGRVQPKDSLLVIIGPRLVGLEPDQAGSLAGGSPADQGSVLTTDRRNVTSVSVACGRFHPASRAPYQRHLRIISPDPCAPTRLAPDRELCPPWAPARSGPK